MATTEVLGRSPSWNESCPVAMLGYSSAEEVLKLSVAQDVFSEPERRTASGCHKWQLTGRLKKKCSGAAGFSV